MEKTTATGGLEYGTTHFLRITIPDDRGTARQSTREAEYRLPLPIGSNL